MSASFVAVGNNVPGVISWNMSLFFSFFFFSVFIFCERKEKGRRGRGRRRKNRVFRESETKASICDKTKEIKETLLGF